MYFIEDKPFPIFPRAVEQILYDVSVRSTGAFASVMRKTDIRPRIVHNPYGQWGTYAVDVVVLRPRAACPITVVCQL